MISDGGSRRIISRAVRPSAATSVTYPSFVNRSASRFRAPASPSTTRTRPRAPASLSRDAAAMIASTAMGWRSPPTASFRRAIDGWGTSDSSRIAYAPAASTISSGMGTRCAGSPGGGVTLIGSGEPRAETNSASSCGERLAIAIISRASSFARRAGLRSAIRRPPKRTVCGSTTNNTGKTRGVKGRNGFFLYRLPDRVKPALRPPIPHLYLR